MAEAGRRPGPPICADTCGRGGRLAFQVAGMRTTTPAALELRDVAQKLNGLLGRPAERVENLTSLHQGFQPGASLRGALHRQEERQQAVLVGRARIFPESFSQRQMLGLGAGGQAGGISREKGERRIRVFAVFGQIEVDAAQPGSTSDCGVSGKSCTPHFDSDSSMPKAASS